RLVEQLADASPLDQLALHHFLRLVRKQLAHLLHPVGHGERGRASPAAAVPRAAASGSRPGGPGLAEQEADELLGALAGGGAAARDAVLLGRLAPHEAPAGQGVRVAWCAHWKLQSCMVRSTSRSMRAMRAAAPTEVRRSVTSSAPARPCSTATRRA